MEKLVLFTALSYYFKRANRRSYMLEDKLEVVKRLRDEFDGNRSAAARATGIDRKRLRTWDEQAESLSQCNKKRERRHMGGGRTAKYPELEDELFSWFKDR